MGRLASIIAIIALTFIPLPALEATAAEDPTPPPSPAQKQEQKPDSLKSEEGKAPVPEQDPPEQQSEGSPWDPVAPLLKNALHEWPSLALIRPEVEGINRKPGDLEAWLNITLSQIEGLSLVPPEQVQARAGLGFAISAQGLGRIARKSKTKAALFVRLIHSPEGTDLMLLLVDDKEQIMLDEAVPIERLPQPDPPMAPMAPVAHQPQPQDLTEDQPSAFEGDDQSRETAPDTADQAQPVAPGPSSEEIYRLRQLNLQARPGRPQGFIIQRSDRAIGELELAQMTGRQDLVLRIQNNVDSLSFKRSLGMGLTLVGFAAAGMATPLYKSSKSGGEMAGALITGLGAATGVAGAVVWYLYGAEAEAAGGPSPVDHLLTRDEAQHMIRAYNSALQRELNIPRAPADSAQETKTPEIGFQWLIAPGPNSVCALATIRY